MHRLESTVDSPSERVPASPLSHLDARGLPVPQATPGVPSSARAFTYIVGRSAAMSDVSAIAKFAAGCDAPVLILGETGTGKELLARDIHDHSRRSGRPFVPVNAAALPRDLVETELFGHQRGAFSGAYTDHAGLFEAAHRGTLFLDEIGEVAVEAQAKLLRALQGGEIRRVGGVESRIVDVRVIAATNRTVQKLRSGVLRRDLFYRLSVLVINLPALRQRKGDIPQLVKHFLHRYSVAGISRLREVDEEAMKLLTDYDFPGNIRELESLVESLCITARSDQSTVRREDVAAWFRRHQLGITPRVESDRPVNLRELEAWAIRHALVLAGGNKSCAARLLGISRDSLYRKLEQLDGDHRGRQVAAACSH